MEPPGVYHGPGQHADDCDCADCLAQLPAEWFEEYEQHRADEERTTCGPRCGIVEVDGEPVRVQGDPGMPDEVREALADVVRTVRSNHGEAAGD
jgi:hypothetical protein